MIDLMGNCTPWTRKRKDISLMVVGLDGAGKTTVVYGIAGETLENVAPTVGFSSLKVTGGQFNMNIIDLGGGERIRDIWRNYMAEVHGVVFVVDASNTERLEECKEVLDQLMQNDYIRKKPVLILANKQDKEEAMNEDELIDRLQIEHIANDCKCPCRVVTCAAIRSKAGKRNVDKAVLLGFNWLQDVISHQFPALNQRVLDDVRARAEQRQEELRERAERVRLKREERARREAEEMEQPVQVNELDSNVSEPTILSIIADHELNEVDSARVETPSRLASGHHHHPADSRTPPPSHAICLDRLEPESVRRSGLGDELLDDDDDIGNGNNDDGMEFHQLPGMVFSVTDQARAPVPKPRAGMSQSDANAADSQASLNESTADADKDSAIDTESIATITAVEPQELKSRKSRKKRSRKKSGKNRIIPLNDDDDEETATELPLAPVSLPPIKPRRGGRRLSPLRVHINGGFEVDQAMDSTGEGGLEDDRGGDVD